MQDTSPTYAVCYPRHVCFADTTAAGIGRLKLTINGALGTNVDVVCTANLPSLVYILELRTQKTVHPTLRKEMQKIGRFLQKDFPDIPMYIDYDEDEFSLKRGSQTIIEK